MTRILVPYHLDDYLPDLDVPVGVDTTVTVELPPGEPWARMAQLCGAVADAVAGADRPVVVSGDCLTSLGVLTGLQRSGVDPGIVWFDAHGDVQTMETTGSGYLGGMPLRIMVGYRPDLIAQPLGLRPVPEDRVVLVDARDLDPAEVEYLEGAAIRRSSVHELTEDGLPSGPLHLHVDLDIIDPQDVAGLRFPAPGGPRLAAVVDAVRRVLDTGRVSAVGLACTWHPGHGAADRIGPGLEALLAGWGS